MKLRRSTVRTTVRGINKPTDEIFTHTMHIYDVTTREGLYSIEIDVGLMDERKEEKTARMMLYRDIDSDNLNPFISSPPPVHDNSQIIVQP